MLNNEYLRRTANAVDGGDTPEGARVLNNEYLRRISEGIGGIVKPETGKVDASKIDGVIPAANLPSFVDDVVEGYLYQGDFYSDSQHTYEITPEAGKIYVDLSADTSYRWGGSSYVAIGRTLDAASQAEAEAGQDNAKYMTPLRTKQAIDALTPTDLGITGATAGQVPQVATVDNDGAPQSWSSLSVLPTVTTLDAPSTLTVQNMVEYHLTNVTTLVISYPQTPFDCWISMTTGASVDVSLPASDYIGDPPVIGPYEKWELSIRNGVVIAGKAVADA